MKSHPTSKTYSGAWLRVQRRLPALLLAFASATCAWSINLDDVHPVTLRQHQVSVRTALDEIARQSGVNVMYRIGEEEFARRVRAFLSELRKGTDAPVFCTDCFTFAYAQSKIPDEKYRAFKRAVQNAVSECGGKNSYYIDGETLLKDYRHLSADGVHPDVFGHMEIGSAFAEKIAARTGLKLQSPLF